MKSLFLFFIIVNLYLFITSFADSVSGNDVPHDDETDNNAEDIALAEINYLQQIEHEEQEALRELKDRDAHIAYEAEKAAKQQELEELEKNKKASESQQNKAESNADLEWVKRNRPGAEAKPGANLKAARTGSDDISAEERKDRDRVPESQRGSGGSYFGESKTDKAKAEKAAEESKRAQEKDKISSGAGDRRREVEGKINPETRAKAAADLAKKASEEKAKADWELRARLPRRYAKYVEQILREYGDETYQHSCYSVLGVSKSASDDDIKKVYRQLALRIHPDKNPHPDAKAAFDILQEVFSTLSSPVKRAQHDDVLQKKQWLTVNAFVPSKLFKYLRDTIDNLKSRSLLFHKRYVTGEIEIEIKELKERFYKAIDPIMKSIQHFTLLTTVEDRIHLAIEKIVNRSTLYYLGLFILFKFIF